MAVIKCKMCGGDLVLTEGSLIAECEYCGSLQTVPNAGNEKMLTLFARANRLRANCEFDKAFGVYETIVADFPEEAEAYWGLVLCKYGIEYVDDPATHKKIATCHRSSFQSVMEDEDFEQTLENADAVARKVYREEAKQIEELRKGILEVSSKEEPYDIFICYKETDEKGERTLDSVLAQDIYDALTEKGYRVFFSRITLENKLGQEYEPYIFAALNSAKVMLVVGTDYEHFNAVWVRNEWSRYIKRMETDKSKHLIPCFKDIDAYDMPKEFAKLQAQDLGKVGATQDLLRGIDKLIVPAAGSESASRTTEIAPLLALGSEALEEGDWGVASSRFDLVLTVDPTCVDAYVGKLMAECKCKKISDLAKAKKSLKKNSQYRQAIMYADETLKKELEGYCKKTTVRHRVRVFATLVAIVSLVVTVGVGAYYGLETYYRNIIVQFYSNHSVYAQQTFTELSNLSWYKKADPCTQYLLQKEIPGAYPAATSLEKAVIPDGVTIIVDSAFQDCDSLVSIELPDSVTSIGSSAFKDCDSLVNIELPDSVTSIGSSAFQDCDSLVSIELPDSVTHIGSCTFQDCSSLTSAKLSNSIVKIGDSAFGQCSNLTSVELSDNLTNISSGIFQDCISLTSVQIPNNVTSIGVSAFSGCANLKSIEIPDSVTSIDNLAFTECDSLTSIRIPKNVTSIGYSVFEKCKNLKNVETSIVGETMFRSCDNLTNIKILDGANNIKGGAFLNCSNLTTVEIPNAVTNIGRRAFGNCSKIQQVYYTGTREQWEKISIGDSNKYILNAEIHYEYTE